MAAELGSSGLPWPTPLSTKDASFDGCSFGSLLFSAEAVTECLEAIASTDDEVRHPTVPNEGPREARRKHNTTASSERITPWPVRAMSTVSNPEIRAGLDTDAEIFIAGLEGDECQVTIVKDGPSLRHAVPRYTELERAPLGRSSSMIDLSVLNECPEERSKTNTPNSQSAVDSTHRPFPVDGSTAPSEDQDRAGPGTAVRRQSLSPLRLWIHENADISVSMPALTGSDIMSSALAGTGPKPTDAHASASSSRVLSDLPGQTEGLHNLTAQIGQRNNDVHETTRKELGWSRSDPGSASPSSVVSSSDSEPEDSHRFIRSDTPWVGLERVNTKLTAWSWSGGLRRGMTQNDSQIPLRAGVARSIFDHILDDDVSDKDDNEDQHSLGVPPNSNIPSQRSSRQPSRPPSVRTAFDTTNYTDEECHDAGVQRRDNPLSVPGQCVGDRTSCTPRKSCKRKVAKLARVLSNLPGDETHFTGHRDSVALAHQRIIHVGANSPNFSEQSTSIGLAKQRIKNGPTYSSMSRTIPGTNHVRFGGLSPIADSSL